MFNQKSSDQLATPTPVVPGQEQPKPEAGQGAGQPQYLTVEQAQRMAKEAEEAAFRRAQSLIEKSNNKVLEKAQAQLKALEASIKLQRDAGIPITPQQESDLKQTVLQKAFTEVEPAPSAPTEPPAAQPNAQQPGGELDPITAEAFQMMKDAGVEIADADPEYKLIDTQTQSARKFLNSVDAAIAAKKQRLSLTPGASPGTTHAPTNLGGAGTGINPILNNNNPDELLHMALNGSGR